MHHRDHAHERVTFNEHDRVWESDQQLATDTQVAWKADDGSAFRTWRFECLKRGAHLVPEFGAEALAFVVVMSDRVRDLLFGLRINADLLGHRLATRDASRR